jgi:hypothetical protein
MIGFIIKEFEHVVDIYNISNGKNEHLKGWKCFIGQPQD